MGLILSLLIILLALFVLGVEVHILIGIILCLLGAIVLTMLLFFAYFAAVMIRSKKAQAVFSRIDKSPKANFDCAYYIINGVEYPNAFPCENLFAESLYRTGEEITVRFSEKTGSVIDKNAFITSVAGLASSAVLFAAAVFIAVNIL